MSRSQVTSAIVDLPNAKGDIYTATADNTPARLGVGTDGQILTASAAASTGLAWATPAGGGGMTLLSTTSIGTSTTTSLTGISQAYTHLVVLVKDFFRTGSNTTVSFRFGNGFGETSGYYYNGIESSQTTGYVVYNSNGQDAIYMDTSGLDNRQQPNNFQITFPFYSQASLTKTFNFESVSYNGSYVGCIANGYGSQGLTSVINWIDVKITSTPDTGGTVYLYGVK